jgi:hypothetical protein
MGTVIATPAILQRQEGGWLRSALRTDPVELTETTEKMWLHTRLNVLPILWNLIETLLSNVRGLKDMPDSGDKRIAVLDGVAQIHWWFSQAMPYRRGSAAIGDMLTKAVLEFHQLSTPCWRAGVAPDLEALCSPLEEYVERYPDLFITPPTFVNAPTSIRRMPV